MNEIWKSVVGYEGLYEVSNHGNVRDNDGAALLRGRRRGHAVAYLIKNGKRRICSVFRIVGEAFGGDLSIQILPEDAPLEGEEFRWVVEHEGRYAISNLGRVKSFLFSGGSHPGKILRPCVDPQGYAMYSLGGNGKLVTPRGHTMVLQAFVGPRPYGSTINHKDGKKTNNRLDNLEYCTPKENIRHSIEVLGNRIDGENNPRAKLTASQVREIRRLHANGNVTMSALARQFGVSHPLISDIIKRKIWLTA